MGDLQRDILLAKEMKHLGEMHEGLISAVGTVKAQVDKNSAQLSRILNLPKGERGERGQQGPRGIPGRDGKNGTNGKDGLTPVKGRDYMTREDNERLLVATLARIRDPKDGQDAVVDEEKIANLAVKIIRDQKLITSDHVGGLREEISSYRNQMALRQAGQHGGGMTLEAGTNITLTPQSNGTTLITATGAGTGTVTDFSFTDANGITGVVTNSTTIPNLTLDISGLDAAKIANGSVSDTEFQYLNGVTSAIQTQLDAKITNPMTTGGDLIYGGASGTPTRLANGTAGQILTSNGTTLAPTWEDASAGGNVSNTGTPLNNQIAVWTDATTIEGTSGLTYDGANFLLTGDIGATGTRITKGWFTDLQVTNAIVASITGNAATATSVAVGGITGLGTGVGTALAVNVGSAGAFVVFDGALGTPSSGTLTNTTGLPVSTGISGLGTNVATALAVNVGTAGAFVVNGGALGTPSSGTVTNLTGTASININGTVGATTPTTGVFTTLVAGSTTSLLLGTAGSAVGNIGFRNGTSGTITLAPVAGALGTVTLSLPARTDTLVTLGGTETLTAKTLTAPSFGGTAQFLEGGAIAYDAASSADGIYTGFVRAGTAGATLAFGDLVYLASADSRWELADADAATTSDRFLGMCVLAAASDGDPTTILLMGFIRADAAFPAMTIGSAMYVGETAGDIQVAIPTGADNVIRRVGYAWTADELYFNPSMDSQVTVA